MKGNRQIVKMENTPFFSIFAMSFITISAMAGIRKPFYFLLHGSFYLFSLLPFWLLYLISDGVYVIIFYVVGYRKKVVYNNLRNAFPEKNDKEIDALARRYYHYMCDLLLETFKTLSMSPKTAVARCKFENVEPLKQMHTQGKSIMIVMGHYGNWEWGGNAVSIDTPYKLYVIYHPLRNPYFDKLIYGMRTRFGTGLIAMNNTLREMLKNRDTVTATAFIADQTPSPENAYWTQFLNQDTPMFRGMSKISQKLGYPLVYATVQRVKRGYYSIRYEVLVANPKEYQEDEILEMYTRRLEKDIVAQPEIWLWSHNRWKYKR